MASRGPAEIASCLWHWLGRLYAEKNIPSEWVAYSDSCGSQNRKAVIAAFWSHAVQEMEVDCIDHIFMVSGHSFIPCDETLESMRRKSERMRQYLHWVSGLTLQIEHERKGKSLMSLKCRKMHFWTSQSC